ncbi:MAG: hypothetical protein ACRDVM_02315 [Acidimicrobiia bacterium]
MMVELMHKTTINRRPGISIRLRSITDAPGASLGETVNLLRAEAPETRASPFASHAVGDAHVDDLAVNAEKYLSDRLS